MDSPFCSSVISCVFPVPRYSWVAGEDLLVLPVGRMLAPSGLVAVWVTNKRKFVNMVTETLFPSWGVQPVAEWLWLKVSEPTELRPVYYTQPLLSTWVTKSNLDS